MEFTLLLCSGIILLCILANRFSNRLGMPALILFMLLGMLFGSDGLFQISFDNYEVTEKVCTVALAFIMFDGGFSTKWKTARPIAAKAIVLSTFGVVLTAGLVTLFCWKGLHYNFYESFLIGSVLGSTDAASVFFILRSKNLSCKEGTAPLLEIESGSNDPTAYMLTMIGLSLINGGKGSIFYMLFAQLFYGIGFGILIALIARFIFSQLSMVTEGLESIFLIAIVLLSYSLPCIIGGNGFLSVYLVGIILGNSKLSNKNMLVHFFDGITSLAQIAIFFLLGLLSFPHKLPESLIPALFIALFLSIVARPIAVFSLMLPFRSSIRQCLLVSWSGLRGAASIVFSIMVVASGAGMHIDLFHIVFTISLISVAIQGAFLPKVAEKLNMLDEDADVRKTFTDYQEDGNLAIMRMRIDENHNWANKKISEVHLPTDALALMIKRDDETLIPKGNSLIFPGDNVILSVPAYHVNSDVALDEIRMNHLHQWCGKKITDLELPPDILIAMIKRDGKTIIPNGNTKIREEDTVIVYQEDGY